MMTSISLTVCGWLYLSPTPKNFVMFPYMTAVRITHLVMITPAFVIPPVGSDIMCVVGNANAVAGHNPICTGVGDFEVRRPTAKPSRFSSLSVQ